MPDKNGGRKFDQGKPRTDLLPSKGLVEIAKVLAFGAKKYDAHNWRKGIEWSRCFAAIQRHLLAWNDGETYDPETGINHLAHAGTTILFLLEYAETHRELDNRYKEPYVEIKPATTKADNKTNISIIQPEGSGLPKNSSPL